MAAAGFFLFGLGEFAARLPSALMGLACMVVVYRLARGYGADKSGGLPARRKRPLAQPEPRSAAGQRHDPIHAAGPVGLRLPPAADTGRDPGRDGPGLWVLAQEPRRAHDPAGHVRPLVDRRTAGVPASDASPKESLCRTPLPDKGPLTGSGCIRRASASTPVPIGILRKYGVEYEIR